jgi:DNA-directed RNA polymerase specialized sigma24 family protein
MCDDPISDIERRLYYEKLYRQLPMKTILKDLTEEEKDLLRLHILEQRSAKEIAELLDKDVKDVRWQWNQLSMKLRTRARSVVKNPPKML